MLSADNDGPDGCSGGSNPPLQFSAMNRLINPTRCVFWGAALLLIAVTGCSAAGSQIAATPTPPSETLIQPPAATVLPTLTLDIAPTLPVPTPLPSAAETQPTPRPTVSALERVRAEGDLRVGVLYNTPPLSSLNERGQVEGYEVDLARAIAEAWGVEAVFVQVTRQTAVPLLLAGEVDMLMASIVHSREMESLLGFSQTYFPGGQMFLVREESAAQQIAALDGQPIGVVQGTRSERALGRAISAGRLNVTPHLYLTLDQAVGALDGEVAAVLSDRVQLLRVDAELDGVRILNEMLETEPYAVAFRRHDEALHYLLDRTLQALYAGGRLQNLRQTWFPGVVFDLELPVWDGLEEDTRTLADLSTATVYPQAPIVPRVQAGQAIRVAGLNLDPAADDLTRRLEGFYQALVQEIAARWGVSVEFIPHSAANALDLVAGGQVEMAVGVAPTWAGPAEVTYTAPIIAHGDRLMVPFETTITDFADLRGGQWVGVFASEPGAANRVTALAEEARARINVFTILRDEDAVFAMMVDGNADVVYGDSLRLFPHVQANPDLVKLTDRWYSRAYIALAVPRVDPDFAALVDVTLQEMDADGTFARLWASTLGLDMPIRFEQWPGEQGIFEGVRTSAPAPAG